MNKKLLLASLMVSVMGFSSLFAVEDEDVNVKSEQCRSCGCNSSEEKKQCISCDCNHEEEEKTSLISDEEDVTTQAISCDRCDKVPKKELKGSLISEEEDVTTQAISCERCDKLSSEDEIKESLVG